MECLHCKGRLQRGLPPFSIDRRGYVRWDGIPVWVCAWCGEPLFDTHVVEEIQRTLDALDGATDRLATAG